MLSPRHTFHDTCWDVWWLMKDVIDDDCQPQENEASQWKAVGGLKVMALDRGEGKLDDRNVFHAARYAQGGVWLEDALTSSSLTFRGSL